MQEKNNTKRDVSVQITDTFDAICSLDGIAGLKGVPYGHTWVVTIRVVADGKYAEDGIVVMFEHLRYIIKQFDHKNLNDFVEPPTAENVAQRIADDIWKFATFLSEVRVTVLESSGASAQVLDRRKD
jgi:6-pyruvoyl-tetrahydropterin synthase